MSLERAQEALKAKDWTVASALASQILASEPDSVPALRVIAEAKSQLGELNGAIAATERLLSLEPPSPRTLGFLTSLYWRAGQIAEAAKRCEQLVEIEPHNAGAFNSLGMCRLSLEDWPGAVDAFKEAVRLNPDWADFHHNYAGALDKAGSWEEAAAEHVKALELKPGLPSSLFGLADLHVRLANAESAKHMLRRLDGHADSLDPQARLNAAAQLLGRLLSQDPSHARARVLLASILEQQGNHNESLHELELAIQSDPALANAYWHLTRSKKLLDEDRPLIQKMEALLPQEKTDKGKILLHNALGKALDDLKEYDAALDHYDQAHEIARTTEPPFDREAFKAQTDAIISFFNGKNPLGSNTELPVFVVGMPRSGTTLTEQILASHPEVAGAGELPFWPDLANRAWDPQSQTLNPDAKQIAGFYIQALQQIDPGQARVVDKNPFNYLNVGLLHLLFPNAHIVHCLRHPVDNCISIYMANFAYPPAYAHNKADLVFAYREHLRLLEHWKQTIPGDRFTIVRYEDLIEQRESETKRLIEFVGLDWNEACLYPERNERVVLTASQWQVRQPVYRTSLERWKRYEKGLGEFRELL